MKTLITNFEKEIIMAIMIDDYDPINYLSIAILENMGNPEPSQPEIDMVESVLAWVFTHPQELPASYQ